MSTRIMGAVALAALFAATASAGLIIEPNPVTLKAYGFGVVAPLLTLQAAGFESGCVSPGSGGLPVSNCGVYPTYVSDPYSNAGLTSGKYSTPTLGSVGISDYSQLRIIFNMNESGDNTVTIRHLTLGVFNGTSLVQSFSLAAAQTLTAAGQGQSTGDYIIRISPDQYSGLTLERNYTVGMAAYIDGTTDGAESFSLTADPVPDAPTAFLIGAGLMSLGVIARRRRTFRH